MAKTAQAPAEFRPRHPYGFDHFDPLTGTIPRFQFGDELELITARARALLTGRTREHILFAASSINWLLDQIQPEDLLHLAQRADAPAPDASHAIDLDDPAWSNDCSRLLRCHDRFDITGQPSLPNASWVDYFAVLALAYVNAACEELAYRRSETRWNLNVDADARALAIFLMGQYAVVAMEAVCVAESFRRQEITERRTAEQTEIKHSEKISLRMQNAAIARHGPTNTLIKECHQLWLELKKRGGAKKISMQNAAREFLKTIPEERVRHLLPENRIYVLARGISQYARGKRKLKTTPPD